MERWDNFDGGRPRAPRFAFDVPLQYRRSGETAWRNGRGTNISRSGVLFHTDQRLDVHSPIDVSFHVPIQLRGEGPASVLCRGRIVRQVATAPGDIGVVLAATIDSYRFQRDRKV